MTTDEGQAWKIEQVAKRAAKEAVRETLLMLGTDLADQKQVNELRDALEFSKDGVAIRNARGIETRKGAITAAFSAVSLGVGAALAWAAAHVSMKP